MEAIECILTRKSVRKFRPDAVPRKTLTEVLAAATRSPSYRNSQPWSVDVVSGRKKDELSDMLVGLVEKDVPIMPDIPEPTSWPEAVRERMRTSAERRNRELGVDATKVDSAKMGKLANFRFYGAPHVMFIYQDSVLSLWSLFDAGCFAQTLMLAANAYGLGTVPQGYLTDYSPDVKRFLGVPQSKRLVLGMSIGYPDASDKAAVFRSDRIPVDEVVRWVE
ncbi:MAG: nitroreductase [Nitrospinae bacterium]|nr:nitroreductase [Nitrospinota bacterium]